MDYKTILGEAWTDDIEKALKRAVGEEFVIRSDFNNVKNELKQAKTDLGSRDKQLDELKAATGDADALKQQIAALQEDNKTKAAAYDAEIKQIRINSAVDRALIEARAKLPTSVLPHLDLKSAVLQEDGTILGLSEQIDKLVKGDATSFLFDQEKPGKIRGVPAGAGRDEEPGATESADVAFAKSLAAKAKPDTTVNGNELYFGK